MESLLKKIDQNILHEVDEIIYIFKRYKIPSTVCVAKISNDVHLEDIRKNIRRTDKVFQRGSCFIIIYKFVHAENGVKAFQNLIHKLNLDRQRNESQHQLENKIDITETEDSKETVTFYKSLFQKLTDSMKKRRTIKSNSFLSALYQTAKGAASINELKNSIIEDKTPETKEIEEKDVVFFIHPKKIEDVTFSSSFYQIKTTNISSKEIIHSSIRELFNSTDPIKIID